MTMSTEAKATPAMRVVSAVRYLSPAETQHLATASGINQSSTLARRQAQMLGLMQAVGGRLGLPQRTVATAQLLYLRFHLFYKARDFIAHEVATACIVVAGKMCDTPKKARDVILHSWALRFPELAHVSPPTLGGQSTSTVSSNTSLPRTPASSLPGLAHIPESSIDAALLEKERKRVVSIEALLLQSIAFAFNTTVRDNLRYTIKLARRWELDNITTRLAWQIAADCHRTYAPLSYTPTTIALASIYIAALFCQKAAGPGNAQASVSILGVLARFAAAEDGESRGEEDWQKLYATKIDRVEAVMHLLLDMYESSAALTSSTPSAAITPISPATPASPSEVGNADTFDGRSNLAGSNARAQRKLPAHVTSPPPFGMIFWHSQVAPVLIQAGQQSDVLAELTQLKIFLRKKEGERRRDVVVESAIRDMHGGGPRTLFGDELVRPMEIGGVRGDIHGALDTTLDGDNALQQVDLPATDGRLVTMQRFLF